MQLVMQNATEDAGGTTTNVITGAPNTFTGDGTVVVNAGSVTITTTGTPTGVAGGASAATTSSPIQSFRNQAMTAVASNAGAVGANSDYKVAFAAPAGGGQAAAGYPVFEQGGQELVGVYVYNAGSGYVTGEAPSFWVIPNGISLAEYADGTALSTANPNNGSATGTLTPTNLTITFNDGGLGYAVRPEFRLFGGNRFAEDLAGVNANISANLRPKLNFNGAGSITNPSVVYTGGATLPFTAAGLAAEPITVSVTVSRIEGIFTSEVNGGLENAPFNGAASVGRSGDTYTGAYSYLYEDGTTGLTADRESVTAETFFDALEAAYPVAFASAGATVGKYITAPTFTVISGGSDVGTVGTAVLNGAADIVSLTNTTTGTTVPRTTTLGNDFSVPTAGERFRTIGGSSSFEVFSGLTYVRDVNYGTGIELE